MRFSVADTIAARCFAHPERIALEVLDGGEPMRYSEVWRRIVALERVLTRARQGRHGRMVGVFLENGADAALALAACQRSGCIAAPVNARLADPEIRYVLTTADVRLLLTGGALADRARSASASLDIEIVDVALIPTPASAERPLLGEREIGESFAAVSFTSGTTGFPKGAVYTNDYFTMNNYRWGWEFGLSSDHVVLIAGPMFHLSYAGFALAGLSIGARVRILREFSATAALEELSLHSSFAFLVPSMLTMIAEEWEARGRPPLEAARLILSAGAPGPLELTRKAMTMFPNAKIAEMYGWTEGAFVTYEVKNSATLAPRCVGWPALGADVAILREDGSRCAVGEPGEIGVKGPVPFAGYLGNPEASAAAWRAGYLMSGDIGVLQPDGRLCIVDRKKDMIISGGENVYPAEVERVLQQHPDIAGAAVVGVPDELWGDRVAAMIVAREGAHVSAQEIESFCRRHLAGYKIPRRIEFAQSLPRNAMGKLQRFKVVELMKAGS